MVILVPYSPKDTTFTENEFFPRNQLHRKFNPILGYRPRIVSFEEGKNDCPDLQA
jgi:hypothetical protein